MGAARLDLDGMRPSARTLFSTRSSCESRNDMMLLYHPPLSDVCEPSPLKGVERRRGGVTASAELAAAGRWSYGTERCVGDLVTVLLHSCEASPPPRVRSASGGEWEELL
jgi:hypothetical protein